MITSFFNQLPTAVRVLLGAAALLYLLWALLPGFLAKGKGRSFWAFFLLGILSPLIVTIVVLCLKDRKTDAQSAEDFAEPLPETEDAETAESSGEIPAEAEDTAESKLSAALEEFDAGNALTEQLEDVTAPESEEMPSEEPNAEEMLSEEAGEIPADTSAEALSEGEKPAKKNKRRTLIAVVLSVLVIAAIGACLYFAYDKLGGCEGIRNLLEPTAATEPIFDPNGAYGKNDVTACAEYTVSEATPTDENMRTVIATDKDGNPALTNSDVQIWYWTEFNNFMQQYGSYASLFGLDVYSPLSSQSSMQEGRSWEQMFLESACSNLGAVYALAQDAYANGYTPTEEDQKTISDISDPEGSLAQAAKEAECATTDEFVQLSYGAGVNLDTYLTYVKMYLASNYAYEKVNSDVEASVTDAAISDFYDEHAAEMEENRILKVNNVSVRHILISPEGEKDETTGEYSEEAWAAAEEKANEIYELWQKDPTEENFAALADENSADGGSNTTGGLYENFDTDDMVEEFSDWSFDKTRKYGDSGIVKTTYGYHIMFFVEQTDTKGWQEATKEQLASSLLNERVEALCAAYPLNFDYTKIRLYDWLTFALNTENDSAASEETAAVPTE